MGAIPLFSPANFEMAPLPAVVERPKRLGERLKAVTFRPARVGLGGNVFGRMTATSTDPNVVHFTPRVAVKWSADHA